MAKRHLPNGAAVPMEPGERDRRVTIEQRPATETVDAAGAPVDGPWTTLATIWMRKMTLRGSEDYRGEQLSAGHVTQWEMAYRADMDPELLDVVRLRRLVHQGRTFDITAADHIGRKEGIELLTLAASQVAA